MQWIERLRDLTRITGITEIARRYFVMNAFDGVLTMLGVIIGAHTSGVLEPRLVIGTGLAATLAMGISGASGAYMTEKAEQTRELKKLESALLVRLDDTRHEDASRFAYVFAALVDGVSPALGALAVLSPIIMANAGLLDIEAAFWASIAVGIAVLVALGLYLAKVSDERLWVYGAQMLVVGVLTVLLCMAIAMVFETPALPA